MRGKLCEPQVGVEHPVICISGCVGLPVNGPERFQPLSIRLDIGLSNSRGLWQRS